MYSFCSFVHILQEQHELSSLPIAVVYIVASVRQKSKYEFIATSAIEQLCVSLFLPWHGVKITETQRNVHMWRVSWNKEYEEKRSAKSTNRKMECRQNQRDIVYVSGERERDRESQNFVQNFHSPLVRPNALKWHSPALAIGLSPKSVYSKNVPGKPKCNQKSERHTKGK